MTLLGYVPVANAKLKVADTAGAPSLAESYSSALESSNSQPARLTALIK
jgi:hypothetical protein